MLFIQTRYFFSSLYLLQILLLDNNFSLFISFLHFSLPPPRSHFKSLTLTLFLLMYLYCLLEMFKKVQTVTFLMKLVLYSEGPTFLFE